MALDPTNFLHSLATWLAAGAALRYAGTPRQLWRQRADESGGAAVIADPYTVLKLYGGPPLVWHPLTRMNVQSQTVATDLAGDEGGLKQAWAVFAALTTADGHPLRMQPVAGYKAADNSADGTYTITYIDPLQRPGMTGRDDRGRSLWTWNMEIGVYRTS